MVCNFSEIVCLICVFQLTATFNVEPVSWKHFTNGNSGFGYKVIQREESLIVSDPFIQRSQNERGQIYHCPVTDKNCLSLAIQAPNEAVNMSLGLSMSVDQESLVSVVCGPTISKNCERVSTYSGMCFKINKMNLVSRPVPKTLRECPSSKIDIAFLLDASVSVIQEDFEKSKDFVVAMIKSFIERDTQFAIAQFSARCTIHYYLKKSNITWWEGAVGQIHQIRGRTDTATAIKHLARNLFVSERGMRPTARKILLVITDGESTDRSKLSEAISEAEAKNITRYAIGVGDAFKYDNALNELRTIASSPTSDHVFKVTDFDALNSIREKLKENIIAIEGTQLTSDSSGMEFAQDGFSVALASSKDIVMSAVGAFQWKGGYHLYKPNEQTNVYYSGIDHDSYLGYSLTIATISRKKYIILGAPRHNHKGQVVVSNINANQMNKKILDSPKPQIGSYFGAEVCVVDLNFDSNTDLLLVSAPTHTEASREGKVFVYFCTVAGWQPHCEFVHELEGTAGQRGRFGSSLASPADLNADGFSDVLIGAPLEDNGQGSVYVFNGGKNHIVSTTSQRITGSSVKSGLHFFGISLSPFSLDLSGDDLPDIAVGSMGQVLLLGARPIVTLEIKVTYSPSKISTSSLDEQLQNTVKVCFYMSPFRHHMTDLAANISYTLELDARQEKYRAHFLSRNHLLSDAMNIGSNAEMCHSHLFQIDTFSEYALSPLSNQLTFTFEGLPSSRKKNLRPILMPGIKQSSDHELHFESMCGVDEICVDDLRMDFNFSGAVNVEVGIMHEINVTVFVENRGENSYNTFFTLKYPFGLSFRRFNTKQGRVECVSQDSETFGETMCHISKPILRENALVVFQITYNIDKESTFGQILTFNGSIDSGNAEHSPNSELTKENSIEVKYAVYLAMLRHDESVLHVHFIPKTSENDKPVAHILKIENDFRDFTFQVFIRVPNMVGEKCIWAEKQIEIPGCEKKKDEKPSLTDFMEVIKLTGVVNCSVAICTVFRCDVNLGKNEKVLFNISGNISSRWIGQTGVKAAVFQLVSSASLDYDRKKFVFFSSDSQHTAPTVQITTQVEVYEEVDLTLLIVGGVTGGLLMLALVTVALYKAGFFNSKYKKLLEDSDEISGEPDEQTTKT